MELFFADDSYQQGVRGGMGEILGFGGLMLPEASFVRSERRSTQSALSSGFHPARS
jgi:hypothetical protein